MPRSRIATMTPFPVTPYFAKVRSALVSAAMPGSAEATRLVRSANPIAAMSELQARTNGLLDLRIKKKTPPKRQKESGRNSSCSASRQHVLVGTSEFFSRMRSDRDWSLGFQDNRRTTTQRHVGAFIRSVEGAGDRPCGSAELRLEEGFADDVPDEHA